MIKITLQMFSDNHNVSLARQCHFLLLCVSPFGKFLLKQAVPEIILL